MLNRCGNALANIIAIVALNNTNIIAIIINASDDIPLPALPAGATDITVILTHNIHTDKDWSLVRGCLVDTDIITNTPNRILNNNNHIVFPNINICQIIYWFKEIILQLFESNRN
ncbi:6371_t:CDS:2 [Funneliformis mosseae]|uniref:6371_t:CDS:1 n=1 Tax=Funneliformis mosseae TaxID=27381 RepID=A0A9N9D750_FUNMO|nr:6371_t:CDS:2 [Funneliformis mosseae]